MTSRSRPRAHRARQREARLLPRARRLGCYVSPGIRLSKARLVCILLLVSVVALLGCSSSGPPTASPTTAPVADPDSATAAVQTIVSNLQLDLEVLGYPGPVSGTFGPATKAALTKFQRDASLPSSEQGVLGPDTAQALGHRLSGATNTVSALQSALTDVGLYTGTIDGHYGPATLAAVKALQTGAHIGVDGLFGPASADALTALYSKDVPERPTPAPPGATTTPPPPADRNSEPLQLGSKGAQVTSLQQRLSALGYRPGAADGLFGAATASAVLAFQKREGLPRDGIAGPAVLAALVKPIGAGPRDGGPRPRLEVDIARQILFVVRPGRPVVTVNVSTGNGETYRVPGGGTDVAYTPVGSFTILRKIPGDHVAPLGTLHSPMYFYKGWALHGSPSVPAYPASHGCVRLSYTDADWLYSLAPVGTVVVIYDTTGKSPGPDGLPANAAAGD